MASISHVLLVTSLIAVTRGLAQAQTLSAQQQLSPPSSVAANGSSDNQPTSIQLGSLHHEATSGCRLRVPDTTAPSPATAKEAAMTNGFLAYTPLTSRCKFSLFLRSTYSPYTFASAGFGATWAQAMGQWPHYGGGAQGWSKRFGATLANTESRRFIQTFALSTILHQDPRYFPSRKRTFISRVWYSATRVLVTKNGNGDSTFNTSEFMGALFTSSLQNAYYPRHDRNFAETMNRFTGALSSDVFGDLLLEFTPDIKRFFRKHVPKRILKIEEKLSIPDEDKP